jgi:hypothetical protein
MGGITNLLRINEEDLEGDTPDWKEMKQLGGDALWTLSSERTNAGLKELLDENLNVFWQSDGPIPHVVRYSFVIDTKWSRRARICCLFQCGIS